MKAGYGVRGTVRSKRSGAGVLDLFKKEASEGRFELVEVPDISVDGAFDDAVKGTAAKAPFPSVETSIADPS